MRRIVSRTLLLVVVALAVAACGDDSGDDVSSEEAFCQSGEQLETDVASLLDMDVVAEGTDAVDDAFTTIRADTDALVAAGQDFAADDINAVEQAVDELGSAVDDLSGELTTDNAGAVATAVSDLGTAVQGLQTTLTETCN
jgi:hypothetical protein